MKKMIHILTLVCVLMLVSCANQTLDEAGGAGADLPTIVVSEDKPAPDDGLDEYNGAGVYEDKTASENSLDEYNQTIASLKERVEESLGYLRTKEADVSGFVADGARVIGWYDDVDRLIFIRIEQREYPISEPGQIIVPTGFLNTIDCYFDEKGNIYITSTIKHIILGSYGSVTPTERKELLLTTDGIYCVDKEADTLIQINDGTDLLIEACMNGLMDEDWGPAGAYGVIKVSSSVNVARIETLCFSSPPDVWTYRYQKVLSDSVIAKAGLYDVFVLLEDGASYSKWIEVRGFTGAIVLEPRPSEFVAEDFDYLQMDRDYTGITDDDKIILEGIDYAFGDGAPLVSMGLSKIAVVDGNSFDLTGELEVGEAYLRVYSRNGDQLEQVMQVDLYKSNGVAYIALSPDEEKVYVVDGELLTVYHIDSGEAVFRMVIYPYNRPFWVGGEHIIFMKNSEFSLIHMADVNAGDTCSITNLEAS